MSNEFESCENSIENLEGEFPVFVARIDASMVSPESTEILDVVLTSTRCLWPLQLSLLSRGSRR